MRLLVVLGLWVAVFIGVGVVASEWREDPTFAYIVAGAGFVYFLPTSIGFIRKHRYRWMILLANLFVGWTGLGLLALFAWSVWPKNTPLNPPLEHSLMAPLGDGSDEAPLAKEKGSPWLAVVGIAGVIVVLAALGWGWTQFRAGQSVQHEATVPVQAAEAPPMPEASAPASEPPTTLTLGVVRDDVLDAGAGCVATNVAGESVFVTDFEAAAVAFNGGTTMLTTTGEQQGVETYADAANEVRVSLTRTGEPVEAGEESSAWPAILTLSALGRETTLAVTLTCGS